MKVLTPGQLLALRIRDFGNAAEMRVTGKGTANMSRPFAEVYGASTPAYRRFP